MIAYNIRENVRILDMSSLRSLADAQVEIASSLFHITIDFTEDVGTRDKNVEVIRVKAIFKTIGMDEII